MPAKSGSQPAVSRSEGHHAGWPDNCVAASWAARSLLGWPVSSHPACGPLHWPARESGRCEPEAGQAGGQLQTPEKKRAILEYSIAKTIRPRTRPWKNKLKKRLSSQLVGRVVSHGSQLADRPAFPPSVRQRASKQIGWPSMPADGQAAR